MDELSTTLRRKSPAKEIPDCLVTVETEHMAMLDDGWNEYLFMKKTGVLFEIRSEDVRMRIGGEWEMID